MSRSNTYMPDAIHDYILSVSVREPDILQRLREETAALPMAIMQVPAEHGQFLGLLVRAVGARRCIEVGVFTGYSSLSVALALPEEGRIIACDVSEEYTSVARRYWMEAGVSGKIDLRIAPALETLDDLIAKGGEGTFDFAFIDADKANYDAYYERALRLLRPGGLIAIDNVLWHGRVVDASDQTPETLAIRALNRKLHADGRVMLSMIPLSDGVTLACKR